MKSVLICFSLLAAAFSLRGQAVLEDGRYPNLLDQAKTPQKFTFIVEDEKGTVEYSNGCTFELERVAPDPKKPNTFVFVEVKPRVASEQCTSVQKEQLDRRVEFEVVPAINCKVGSNGKMRPPQKATPSTSGN